MSTPFPTAEFPEGSHDHRVDGSHDADCAEAVAEIYGFLDGELDAGVMSEIEAHLRRCSPCLEAFDFEVELRRVIVARCTEEVAAELRDRFCRMLRDLGAGGSGGVGVPSTPGHS